jgi:PAS domain S-box-containing protein
MIDVPPAVPPPPLADAGNTLALLLDSTGDGVYGMAPDGVCTFLNRAGAAMLGYAPEELVGRPIHDLIHHHHADGRPHPVTQCHIGAAARSASAVRVDDEVFWHKDGSPVAVSYAVNPVIRDGVVSGAVITFRDVSMQRRAEQELRSSEERYRKLFNSMDEGFCLIELVYDGAGVACDYRFLETNAAFESQSGLADAVGKRIRQMVPDFELAWITTYAEVARSGVPVRFESESPALGIFFDVYASRADSDGRVAILFKDITAKKRAEQLLRASEERVRLATEAAELGLWDWDIGTDAVTWENARAASIFGLARNAAAPTMARWRSDFIHPDDGAAFTGALAQLSSRAPRFHFEGRLVRPDTRSVRWIEMTGVIKDRPDGEPGALLGTVADITPRKRAQAALEASEERFRLLFESIDEGFCLLELITDAGGRTVDYRFLQVNPAFEQQTGVRDAVGQLASVMTPHLEQHWLDNFGRVAATGESLRVVLPAADLGRTFDVYASRAGGPGSLRVTVVFTDITERTKAEDELRRMAAELSEVDRRKNEFLATLAHELRNPLAPLANGLAIVQRLGDDRPARAGAVDMMERQVRHMVRLVDDLLDVARISNGKVELKCALTAIGAVVALAVESSMHLMQEKGHVLDQRLDGADILLDIDGARIAQVVSNLLNNAAKYSPPGASISLTLARELDAVVIAVADNGIGIPARAQASVFDMFTQVAQPNDMAQGGLGIGLSLVRKLVELHGGSVAVASDGPGSGSRFSVRLPLPPQPGPTATATTATAAATPAAARAAAPRTHRILVVDDNVDAADTLAMLLEFSGHQVEVRYDGVAALQHVSVFAPALVFLDIGLPGLNGYEVARAIRKLPAHAACVLVALTGWGADADRARALEAGFDHHLTKPTQIEVLTGLVERIGADIAARAAC